MKQFKNETQAQKEFTLTHVKQLHDGYFFSNMRAHGQTSRDLKVWAIGGFLFLHEKAGHDFKGDREIKNTVRQVYKNGQLSTPISVKGVDVKVSDKRELKELLSELLESKRFADLSDFPSIYQTEKFYEVVK